MEIYKFYGNFNQYLGSFEFDNEEEAYEFSKSNYTTSVTYKSA